MADVYSNIICPICYKQLTLLDLDTHPDTCRNQQMNIIKKYDYKELLTQTQKKALAYSLKKSKLFSKNVYPQLFEKFINLNYTEKELENTINYVKNHVSITINVNLVKSLQYLCNDTHYRNLFETNISGGSTSIPGRSAWEDTLFNKIYNTSTAHYERVKYGAINITNNPKGITACTGYGKSYFLLKDTCKKRTTFVFGDSSKQDIHIATFRHFNSVLYYINNNLLREIVQIANKKCEYSTLNYSPYIEAQIHGPVQLNRDIEALFVNKVHQNNNNICKLLDRFSSRHICPYYWIE